MKGVPSGRKDCGELKTEIAAKIDANRVKAYELTIVASEEAAGQERKGFSIVGSCDGGTKKIVYKRGEKHGGALAARGDGRAAPARVLPASARARPAPAHRPGSCRRCRRS